MKNLLKSAFVCLTFILILNQSYGQINIKLAHKNYTIPKFTNTSVKYPYAQQILERGGVLKPITAAANEVEIRVNYVSAFPLGPASVLILKGDARKFIVENIKYHHARLYTDTLKYKDFKKFADGKMLYRYSEKTVAAPDTLFSSLIKNHLFDFDEKAIRDSLAKANVPVNDQDVLDGYIINVEIKIKDQYRMLRLDPIRRPLDVKELQPVGLLSDTFDSLINLAKLTP